MFHTWTFAHPSQGKPVRARRMALQAPVRVFMAFESWQLSWVLRCINLSETGMLCGIDVINENTAQQAVDLETLIKAEPIIRLQIEHTRPHLFAPVLWARVVRNTRQPWGLELALQFTESDNDLLALLEDLALGNVADGPQTTH